MKGTKEKATLPEIMKGSDARRVATDQLVSNKIPGFYLAALNMRQSKEIACSLLGKTSV